MNQDHDQERTGRRALFAGTKSNTGKEETIPVSILTESVQRLIQNEALSGETIQVFAPLVSHITTLGRLAENGDAECRRLTDQLLQKEEEISHLTENYRQLSSERETYLHDLITSHTEFDRALEIFQYHEVPMVLTGPERTVHDANDVFCTIFAIARSEITTAHPPLSKYIGDEEDRVLVGEDEYDIITLSPPIVPFDHEAVSLIALIRSPPSGKEIDRSTEPGGIRRIPNLTEPLLTRIFDLIPIPAAILDSHQTIILANAAFSRLTGREDTTVQYRDIGSCGISPEISETIADIFSSTRPDPAENDSSITLPDGSERAVYIQFFPVSGTEHESSLLLIAVPAGEGSEAGDEIPSSSHSPGEEREEVLRVLLDLSPSATALIDSHARVIASNEGFSEMTGLSPADLAGTDVRDLGVMISDQVLAPGAVAAEFISGVIRIQSAWGIQESSAMVVPVGTQGDGVSAILVLQPIEAPEPAPAAPSHARPIPAAADPDLIPIPSLVTDSSGTIIRANKAFYALTGPEIGEVTGRSYTELLPAEDGTTRMIHLPSGDITLREMGITSGIPGEAREYWLADVSTEIGRIHALESEIRDLKDEISHAGIQGSGRGSNSTGVAADQIDIVEFELNEERYAIDITMVREVVEMLPITPLPRTPSFVVGILNLRGEVTHIIDLAVLLGQRPKKDRSAQKIIIIPSDVTRGEHVGIIVDNVQSVTEIMGRHISLLGEDISTQIQTHIKGIIKITHDDLLDKHTSQKNQTTLVIWLDIQKILDDIQGTL